MNTSNRINGKRTLSAVTISSINIVDTDVPIPASRPSISSNIIYVKPRLLDIQNGQTDQPVQITNGKRKYFTAIIPFASGVLVVIAGIIIGAIGTFGL